MSNYDQLVQDLHGHVIEVIFRKEDGTTRTMRCTLMKNMLPPLQLKEHDDMDAWTYDDAVAYGGDSVEKWLQFFSKTWKPDAPSQYMEILIKAIIEGTKNVIKQREGKKSLIKVWDINAKGWRSFHIENVISSQLVETI